jgi:hypothetical protein
MFSNIFFYELIIFLMVYFDKLIQLVNSLLPKKLANSLKFINYNLSFFSQFYPLSYLIKDIYFWSKYWFFLTKKQILVKTFIFMLFHIYNLIELPIYYFCLQYCQWGLNLKTRAYFSNTSPQYQIYLLNSTSNFIEY